jgi:hypothetical protein
MILVAAGDSFTYGQELAPPGFVTNHRGLFEPSPSGNDAAMIDRFRLEHAWPSVLRKKLGLDQIVNLGRPGISIDQISSSILEWLDKHAASVDATRSIVVVGWTNPGRISYYDEKVAGWKNCYPAHRNDDPISAFYYQNMHSDEESYHRYWKNVLLVQGVAARLGFKCVMFNAFMPAPLKAGKACHENLVDRSSLCFDIDMMHHCIRHGCKLAPGKHPEIDGHEEWAEYLNRWIRSNPSVIPPALLPSWSG